MLGDTLGVLQPACRTRSRSPVTVEEWVAALPEENNEQLTKVEDSNITTIIITIVIIITLPR